MRPSVIAELGAVWYIADLSQRAVVFVSPLVRHIPLVLFICFSRSVFIQQLSPSQCDTEQEGGEGQVVPAHSVSALLGLPRVAVAHSCAHPAAVSALPLQPLLSAYLEMNQIMTMPVDSGWNFVPFSIAGDYWSPSIPVSEQFHPGGC